MKNQAKIEKALKELQIQPEGDSTFVIFEHCPSEKFVQFFGSVACPLTIDLPWQPLSEVEFYRAAEFFKALGVVGKDIEMLDRPGGKPVSKQFAFQMECRTIKEATQLAIDIFEKVYLFPSEFKLGVTKGWLP